MTASTGSSSSLSRAWYCKRAGHTNAPTNPYRIPAIPLHAEELSRTYAASRVLVAAFNFLTIRRARPAVGASRMGEGAADTPSSASTRSGRDRCAVDGVGFDRQGHERRTGRRHRGLEVPAREEPHGVTALDQPASRGQQGSDVPVDGDARNQNGAHVRAFPSGVSSTVVVA